MLKREKEQQEYNKKEDAVGKRRTFEPINGQVGELKNQKEPSGLSLKGPVLMSG